MKFRKGQNVQVEFTEVEANGHENYTGPAKFVRYVTNDDFGWKWCQEIEPHCIVKVDDSDWGSCFPVRCVNRSKKNT